MASQIIPAHNGKFVTKVTAPDGAVGYVASDVPESAVRGLLKKLLARKALAGQMKVPFIVGTPR